MADQKFVIKCQESGLFLKEILKCENGLGEVILGDLKDSKMFDSYLECKQWLKMICSNRMLWKVCGDDFHFDIVLVSYWSKNLIRESITWFSSTEL